jgi:hypothetical protein
MKLENDSGRSPGSQVIVADPAFPADSASGAEGSDSLLTVAGAALALTAAWPSHQIPFSSPPANAIGETGSLNAAMLNLAWQGRQPGYLARGVIKKVVQTRMSRQSSRYATIARLRWQQFPAS